MFTEVREKRGLCYAIYSANDHNYDSGYVSMYAGLKTEKISEAIKLILNEYMSIANRTKKISKKELTKAKEYMKGHTALSLEDTKGSSYFAATDELYLGRIRTPEEIYSEIDKVNVDEIYDLARKLFVTKSLNLSIIGPFKDNGMFVKLIK